VLNKEAHTGNQKGGVIEEQESKSKHYKCVKQGSPYWQPERRGDCGARKQALVHTCKEGERSSSDATMSWVATSGFHCKVEQRRRLVGSVKLQHSLLTNLKPLPEYFQQTLHASKNYELGDSEHHSNFHNPK
jgi:hypothetical protein